MQTNSEENSKTYLMEVKQLREEMIKLQGTKHS